MDLTKALDFLEKQGLDDCHYQDSGMMEHIAENMQKYADQQLILSGVRVSFLERKLKKAEQALNDIVKWDDELEDVWGDPGERANSALEYNASMDGF